MKSGYRRCDERVMIVWHCVLCKMVEYRNILQWYWELAIRVEDDYYSLQK